MKVYPLGETHSRILIGLYLFQFYIKDYFFYLSELVYLKYVFTSCLLYITCRYVGDTEKASEAQGNFHSLLYDCFEVSSFSNQWC